MNNHSTESDLTWYFGGEAEADFGVRSVQGGFEAAMHRLALCGRCEPGQVPVHETRQGAPDAEPNERVLDAARRAHEIRQRLDRLPQHARVVLEGQFGDRAHVLGVSVSVLCHCEQTARVVDALNRLRAKKGLDAIPPRIAVLSLACNDALRLQLEALVAEGRQMVDGAVRLYDGR